VTTKKELEKRLKTIVKVTKMAERAWNKGVDAQWKSSVGYTSILMQVGDVALGKGLPRGTLTSLKEQLDDLIYAKKMRDRLMIARAQP
jgi:hypothetical protein